MTEENKETEGTEGTEGTESAAESVTREEHDAVVAERDRYKAASDKARTAAAREAKAEADAKRKAAAESEGDAKLKEALSAAEQDNAKLRTQLLGTTARAVAKEKGAVDPKVVVRLLDFDAMADATDEDEVGAAIDALLEDKPYLKETKKAGTDAGKGSGVTKEVSTDINAALRRSRGRA